MKDLALIVTSILLMFAAVMRVSGAEVTYRPAGTPPPEGTIPYEHKPHEIPDRYLSIVQDRLGHCYTAEAEASAGMQVYQAEVERMKAAILSLQKENATLKSQLVKDK